MGCTTSQVCHSPKRLTDNQKKVIKNNEELQDRYIAELVGAQSHDFWRHDADTCGWELESKSTTCVEEDRAAVQDIDLDSDVPCMQDAQPLALAKIFPWKRRDMHELEQHLRTRFRMQYFGKPQDEESNWHRFARKQAGDKQRQIDMVNVRLESDGVLEAELERDAARAVENYAHFHSMVIGSVDIAKCPHRGDGANICNVVLSSAGLRGWATARVGLPELIMTISSSGVNEIACTTAGGSAAIVEINSNTIVAGFHANLANKLYMRADLLRLVLPSSRLLEEEDHGKYILDVLAEDALEVELKVGQVLNSDPMFTHTSKSGSPK